MACILFVEHRHSLAAPVAQFLKPAGHVVVASTYHAALKKLTTSSFAAVAVTWSSTTPNGRRLIREAKAAHIPVLVITNRLAEAFRSEHESVDVFLERPTTPRQVAEILCTLIDATRRGVSPGLAA